MAHDTRINTVEKICQNKNEPQVDQVELLDVNPTYADITHQDGWEATVFICDLAPYLKDQANYSTVEDSESPSSPLSPAAVPEATRMKDSEDTAAEPKRQMQQHLQYRDQLMCQRFWINMVGNVLMKFCAFLFQRERML